MVEGAVMEAEAPGRPGCSEPGKDAPSEKVEEWLP